MMIFSKIIARLLYVAAVALCAIFGICRIWKEDEHSSVGNTVVPIAVSKILVAAILFCLMETRKIKDKSNTKQIQYLKEITEPVYFITSKALLWIYACSNN